ncbi:hypothetical protein C8R45DRAFT_929351 [Mycena sanguinolenta]|nr:hypothetical protein C8R45DRAFT_929351 [Mycena sanguinolenta]
MRVIHIVDGHLSRHVKMLVTAPMRHGHSAIALGARPGYCRCRICSFMIRSPTSPLAAINRYHGKAVTVAQHPRSTQLHRTRVPASICSSVAEVSAIDAKYSLRSSRTWAASHSEDSAMFADSSTIKEISLFSAAVQSHSKIPACSNACDLREQLDRCNRGACAACTLETSAVGAPDPIHVTPDCLGPADVYACSAPATILYTPILLEICVLYCDVPSSALFSIPQILVVPE